MLVIAHAQIVEDYAGLDITTNKIHPNDQCGIPHHLFGAISAITDDFLVPSFRSIAATTTEYIVRCGRVPILVGGSNSLLHGFLVDHHDTSLVDPFAIEGYRPTLRFQSCLLRIHAHEMVQNEYLNRRIDNMVASGLVEELKEYFGTMSVRKATECSGLSRAIGVPELREYFSGAKRLCDSISEMKYKTQALAKAQTAKIRHMVDVWGWPVCSLDATGTIRVHLAGAGHAK